MLVRSILSNSRLNKLLVVLLFSLVSQQGWAAEGLRLDDFFDAQKLLEYQKRVLDNDVALSNELYKYALKTAKKDWGAAVKGLSESMLIYPSSRALIKLAESKLRLLAKKDRKIKIQVLGDASKYMAVAIELNTVDGYLNTAALQQIENDKNCIDQFLQFKKINLDCRPLRWIKL